MTYLKVLFAFVITYTLQTASASEYREKIQPIFDNRCIACHSCLNGPCQLNLQNFDNFERGASHHNTYEGTRVNSTPPTRPGIDAKTVVDWRKLGFFSVNQSRNLEENIFYRILGTKPQSQREIPFKIVEDSVSCIDNAKQLQLALEKDHDLQMPYTLPPLSDVQRNTLGTWLSQGAKGPETLEMPKATMGQVKSWEKFFNQKSEKEKLVSRYIYEHLFLAHIYFPEAPTSFYRLVRSKTKCEEGIDEIATRRPNDDPGTKEFFYCLKFQDLTIVAKTHLPFEFTNGVLERFKKLFFEEKWDVSKVKSNEEAYAFKSSENPFIAFQDIPAKARYQFLLDNAHFMVSTFIKGPVCNGSNAVNSIQEQFYVMFIKPSADNIVMSKEFETKARDLLILPGVWGSDIKLSETISLTKKIVEHREGYRKLRAAELLKTHPQGYGLSDLWDGEGNNSNATLTVFRHNDNSVVLKGFKGDLSKTLFFLDYALFERLVYNLVVNFDVYGNVSHQAMTRIYMDLIRMEAEEIFLSFLPPETRLPLRTSWYKGILTEAKMKYLFPFMDAKIPTNVNYNTPKNAKKEFIEQVLYNYLSPAVRGPLDALNWKEIALPANVSATGTAAVLREMASLKAIKTLRFPIFFPENSYLIVSHEKGPSEVFTLIKNREHENISWILGESLRMAPSENTLSILEGFYSYYPNQFFEVNEKNLINFKDKALKIKTQKDYKEFTKEFAVSRVSERFWEVYDNLNGIFKHEHPTDFGYLDLTRYVME
jgi:hypothetical protein